MGRTGSRQNLVFTKMRRSLRRRFQYQGLGDAHNGYRWSNYTRVQEMFIYLYVFIWSIIKVWEYRETSAESSVKICSTRTVHLSLNEKTLQSIPLTCTAVLWSIESLRFIIHRFCLISSLTIGFLLHGFIISNRQTMILKIDLRVLYEYVHFKCFKFYYYNFKYYLPCSLYNERLKRKQT